MLLKCIIMRTVWISIIGVFVLLVAFSCERLELLPDDQRAAAITIKAKNGENSFDPHKDVVAKQVKGELQLAITPETLERAVKKANPKIERLTSCEFQVDKDPGEAYAGDEVTFLLVYVDLKDGVHQLIAFDLKKDKIFYRLDMVTRGNSCTGHCCNKCQWSRRAGSSYYTCWCVATSTTPSCGDGTDARCDHTLTMPKADLIKKVE